MEDKEESMIDRKGMEGSERGKNGRRSCFGRNNVGTFERRKSALRGQGDLNLGWKHSTGDVSTRGPNPAKERKSFSGGEGPSPPQTKNNKGQTRVTLPQL